MTEAVERYGLTVLPYPEAGWEEKHGRPIVDIVSVHGLNGHPAKTWTYVDNETKKEVFWLRDLLHHKIPRSRVMTFGYNADVRGNTSTAGIKDNARSVLTHLLDEREDDGDEGAERSIVWVAHSLGGLIVKQALRFAANEDQYGSIWSKTAGVLFLGTPHRGSDVAKWADLGISIAKASFVSMNDTYVNALRTNSVEVMNISEDFRPLAKTLRIFSFYEENKDSRTGSVVVAKWSALMEAENEEAIMMIGADHSGMCKFSGVDDRRFALVWRRIKRLEGLRSNGARIDIATYISLLFPTSISESFLCAIPEPQSGTCGWILEKTAMKTWLEKQTSSLLWIAGAPGCGKTVLMKYLVGAITRRISQQQLHPQPVILNFFCDGNHNDKQSSISTLRCLVHQLFFHRPDAFEDIISEMLRQKGEQTKPMPMSSTKAIWDVFTTAAQRAGTPMYLLIDAVDEMNSSSSQTDLLSKLKDFLVSTQTSPGLAIKILITSRHLGNIASSLSEFPCIEIRPEDTEEDMGVYVKSQVQALTTRRRVPNDFKEEIIGVLLNSPQRTFLWLALILSDLSHPKTRPNRRNFREKLATLPIGLFASYDRILKQIDDGRIEDVRHLLLLLVLANRPFKLQELNMALVIQPTHAHISEIYDELFFSIEEEIESICGPLLEVRNGTVELVHQSAKDFLLNNAGNSDSYSSYLTFGVKQKQHIVIAKACITALQLHDLKHVIFDEQLLSPHDLYRHPLLVNNPFLEYSAQFWLYHIQAAGDEQLPELFGLMDSVFGSLELKRVGWGQLQQSTSISGEFSTPLHIASRFGLLAYVNRLLSKGADPKALDSELFTPLHEAAYHGHDSVVRQLLRCGSPVDSKSWTRGHTALHLAALKGHQAVARSLLDAGADPNIKDKYRWSALSKVSAIGDLAMVRFLVTRGSETTSKDDHGCTPFHRAVQNGHQTIVAYFRDIGVDIKMDEPSGELMSPSQSSTQNPERVAVGIDFGSYHSYVAYIDAENYDNVVFIRNEHGEFATPTVVAFTDNEIVIGEEAVRRGSIDPRNKVTRLKQMLGRCYDDKDIQYVSKEVAFKLVSTKAGLAVQLACSPPRTIPVQEIASKFLRHLRGLVERQFNNPEIGVDAVLTYPPAFPEEYKKCLYRACHEAGIQICSLITEAVAAALPYGFQKNPLLRQEKVVMIYDLGAGTCNVSLVSMEDGIIEVNAVATADNVGGLYFDDRLYNYFIQELKKTHNQDLSLDLRALNRLRLACERVKRTLSIQKTAVLELEISGIEFRYKIDREWFCALCKDLFASTVEVIDRVFRDSRMEKSNVTDLVLVGGSTRIPHVQTTVSSYFQGKDLCKAINPDEAVAYGAALKATYYTENGLLHRYDFLLLDALPRTIGLEVVGGYMYALIKRQTTVPTKKSHYFTTCLDGQERALIRVFAGEKYWCEYNTLLCELWLTGIPSSPTGNVQICVTIDVDGNFMVHVEAEERRTGKSFSRRFGPATACLPLSTRPSSTDIKEWVSLRA